MDGMSAAEGTTADGGSAAVELLGLLADRERLRVFAALVLGPGDSRDVAARAGLPVRDALRALTRLKASGLVGREAGRWVAYERVLADAVSRAAAAREPEEFGAADPAETAVLRVFFRDGRLVSIPAQRTKRLVVLDHVARVFEPGVRYPEREVDAILRVFHPDHAALRRYLGDEGFLSRENGEYWRTGGTVVI